MDAANTLSVPMLEVDTDVSVLAIIMEREYHVNVSKFYLVKLCG